MDVSAERGMVIRRGEIWWASLPEPDGSGPGYRRPVVVIQCNEFNLSRIHTVIIAILTSNTRIALRPGNVLLPASHTGLPRDSAVNISQMLTINKSRLIERVGTLSHRYLQQIDDGLRLVLAL